MCSGRAEHVRGNLQLQLLIEAAALPVIGGVAHFSADDVVHE